ncbi:DUF1998 domain-containing protein [Phycicoccus sp. DTK01]|uniref:DUF1998 domain-containing protein n=1 Tax=Phycicoccus sp. DTK01 TaxID=2785745 RepID=UPI001A8D3EF3|nr:DUF1998 domain-containing protein [Phycicoccus sp. DTK01]GIL33995.1 hypothetical protein PDTK01_00720 [Phycicoccus sp. DTK01]
MSAEIVAKTRRTSLVSTFGVGGLLPAQDDSVMIRGLDDWPKGDVVSEPRLARSLGVKEFRSPSTWRGPRGDVPAVRFPEWAFCTDCRRLGPYWEVSDRETKLCQVCNHVTSPSRFVSCCLRGHIEDFPYMAWVHEDASVSGDGHKLRLESRGATSALSDLLVSCSCGKFRSMEGAFNLGALRGVKRCSGSRPWLDSSEAGCDEELRTLQRGSSNVWFGVQRSAISIPSVPNIADAYIASKMADANPELSAEELARSFKLPPGCTRDDLVRAVERYQNPSATEHRPSDRELRAEEYQALLQGKTDGAGTDQFLCQEVDLDDSDVPELIAQVSRVSRLREVRALVGFTRVVPSTDEAPVALAPLVDSGRPTWYPAIEVLGEGVFVRLDETILDRWASTAFAASRTKLLLQSQASISAQSLTSGLDVSPRVLALHSLAHVLVDEMALTSGYPAASLRERVYDEPGQSGILVYTASADSAGSLGGLAALSDKDRFSQTLANGVRRARWCTSDPVCIESTGSGVNGMNLAACHACLLVPETSCERFNLTLDRAALVGTPQQPTLGLFGGDFV